MTTQITEEYTLPNSVWLQERLDYHVSWLKKLLKGVVFDNEYDGEYETCLDISTQVLEQSNKSGKYVTLTKTQYDGLFNLLNKEKIFQMGAYVKWEGMKVFGVGPICRNIHSLNKYLDLSKSGIPSYEQWMQCVEGVCICSEEDIISNSVISPPIISNEEWERCAELGSSEYGHKTTCFGCGKAVDLHHITFQITLNSKQRQYLGYALRDIISDGEHTYDDHRDNEGKIDELYKLDRDTTLKLMKNAHHKLRSSVTGKISVNPYILDVLLLLCHLYIRAEEPADLEERGKFVDVISEVRELLYNPTNLRTPLCYQCAENENQR